jgi:hypothetical protein
MEVRVMSEFISMETIYSAKNKIEKIEGIEIPIIRRYIDYIMEQLSEMKVEQSKDSYNIQKILDNQEIIFERIKNN